MISIDFSGKTAIVTGGSRGIGLAIVKQLATAGANVALTYASTSPDELATLLASLRDAFPSVRIEAFHLDGANSKSYKKLMEDVSASLPNVDILVANAGKSLHVDAEDMTDDQLLDIFGLNTFGPYYLYREAVRFWLAGGKKEKDCFKGKVAVTVSSLSAHVAMTPQNQAAYNASKAAVSMMTKSLAGEWALTGFRLNSISPGYVWTDMISELDPAWSREWLHRTNLGRMAKAEEIAKSVVSMCSDNWSFQTGSDVLVDGGYHIN